MRKDQDASAIFHKEQTEIPAAYRPVDDFKMTQASGGSASLRNRHFDESVSRLMNIIVATLMLVVLAPILALLAVVIWVGDRSSPIFVHRRIGRYGQEFPCLKFRTMVIDADQRLKNLLASDPVAAREWALDHKLRVDPRITRLGGFMRETSLDELPQLVNVVIGHMSLVGPRPIVQSEVVRYGRYFE